MATLATEHLIDVDRKTGEYISGLARIKQSIETILTTRIGVRLMRLWWGSKFIDMQDKPGNQEVLLTGMMAAISAINTYEPEFKIRKAIVEQMGSDGSIRIALEGVDLVEQNLARVQLTVT